MILDTDVWISSIAKNNPNGILEKLRVSIKKKEIVLLTNDIIIDEWNRNRNTTINAVTDSIKAHYNSAIVLFDFIPKKDHAKFKHFKNQLYTEKEKISDATNRVIATEQLLHSATRMPVTNEMKIKVVDWALKKMAPFTNKRNSVADALNILSSVEYCQSTSDVNPANFVADSSIFISLNHTDISDKNNKDKLHGDLKEMFSESGIFYMRNIGDALNIVPNMIAKYAESIESLLDSWAASNV